MTRVELLANNAEVGGGEVMLLRVARALRGWGLDPRVVGPAYSADLEEATAGAGIEYVRLQGRDRRGYAVALGRWVGTASPGVLWCNGLVPTVATRLARAPRIVHLHRLPTPRQARVLRAARRSADVVAVPSAFLAGRVRDARTLENWTEDLTVIPFAPSTAGDAFRVGFMGRLSPIKGIEVLCDAMDRLAAQRPGGFRLVVAGDDRLVPPAIAAPVRARLARQADVTHLGWVDPGAFFAQVDAVVVPSLVDEAFGLVAAEAMGRGVPVVVSDAGGLAEVVGRDHPWVVPKGDVHAIAAAIESVAGDPDARAAVTACARARWEETYAPAAGHARLASLLQEVGVLPR